jgi:predicted aspartyl protease
MESSLKQTMRHATSAFLIALAAVTWAVPLQGAALSFVGRVETATRPSNSTLNALKQRARNLDAPTLPATARFREAEGRGLLVKVWINNSGPYSFAIDTGAGATIISQRVAAESRIALAASRVNLSGLSGTGGAEAREASLRHLAIGARDNILPGKGLVLVTDALPPDLDGVLDPTESYWPLGYTLDLPNDTISAFDPRETPLRGLSAPPGGAIVQWFFDASSRRPFVSLDAERRALLDTGSGFGLAINENTARSFGLISTRGRESSAGVRDLGRGRINARRVQPITIQIGSLVLRRIPTDLLTGTAGGAPILLGRDALRPFEISFDPVSRLIRLRPGVALNSR